MTLLQQSRLALVVAPLSILRGRPPVLVALSLYLLCGFGIFGAVSYLLIQHQNELRAAAIDYVLPESWHGLSNRLIDFFFESQTRTVLVGLMLNGALVFTSIILFPLKEYCSATFEKQLSAADKLVPDFPLWQQALEELKLLLLYLSMQLIILVIGYYPFAFTQIAASILSVLLLCMTFGLDLISLTLQRHRYRYSSLLKLLGRNWALTLLFGAVFSVPLLLLGQYILAKETLSLIQVASILTLLNLVFLTVAIPAGTLAALRLLPEAEHMPPPTKATKRYLAGVTGCLLVIGLGFHSVLALSLHRKSQVLKCEYSIDWGSLNLDLPSWSELARGQQPVTLQFELQIHNPTPFHLEFEDSQLTLWQNQQLVSSTDISGFAVPSGATASQPMRLETRLNTASLSDWRHLANGWTVQIQFDLLPGLPFMTRLL